jgi:phosphoglycolate phosphatase
MSILNIPNARPTAVLFDWHATLVDTLDAMYRAVDDLLPELSDLGLSARLVEPEAARSPDDERLVAYVRERQQLHPKIKADRKISRTDIFEVLFGDDSEAKRIAHAAFCIGDACDFPTSVAGDVLSAPWGQVKGVYR